MARMVDLAVVRYDWVEDIADPLDPTVAELNAGENISQYLTTNTSFGAEDPDTVSERGITDTVQIDVPTIEKVAATLEFFRDITLGTGALTADDLTNIFTGANEQGYLVRRLGLPHTTAYAAAQTVEIGKFIASKPKIRGGEGTGYLKASVKLNQAGFYEFGVVVAA